MEKAKARRNRKRLARQQAIASGEVAGVGKSSMAMDPLDMKVGKTKVARNAPNGKNQADTTACTGEQKEEH